MVSVQFCKKVKGLSLCDGWTKKSSSFYQTFLLIVAFKKLHCQVYCYFRVLVIRLIKTMFNETSTVRNSKNSWPLYLNFLNMINLFYFVKRAAKKNQFFKEPLFRNGWLCWCECWCVWRDFFWLSKKCNFATFPKR